MDMRHDLVRVLDAHEDHVVDSVLDEIGSAPDHGERLRIAEPVLDDADIVRGKVPERVDVRPDLAEIQPLAVNVPDIAQLAGVDQFFHVPHGAVEQERVPDHCHKVLFGGAFPDRIDLRHAPGHRLLDQDVLACGKGPHRQIKVGGHGSRDHNRIDPGVLQHLFDVVGDLYGRIQSPDVIPSFRRKVHDRRYPAFFVRNEVPEEIRAPVSHTDLRYLYHCTASLLYDCPALPNRGGDITV